MLNVAGSKACNLPLKSSWERRSPACKYTPYQQSASKSVLQRIADRREAIQGSSACRDCGCAAESDKGKRCCKGLSWSFNWTDNSVRDSVHKSLTSVQHDCSLGQLSSVCCVSHDVVCQSSPPICIGSVFDPRSLPQSWLASIPKEGHGSSESDCYHHRETMCRYAAHLPWHSAGRRRVRRRDPSPLLRFAKRYAQTFHILL